MFVIEAVEYGTDNRDSVEARSFLRPPTIDLELLPARSAWGLNPHRP